MSPIRTLAAVAILSVVGLATQARAQNLFVISGTSNGNPFTSVGGDSLIDLVTDAVNNEGAFAPLANTDATLNVNYGGIENAIAIDKNAANTFATLSFINPDGTRTVRTFDAAAAGRPLEDLIEDYLRQDGADDLASFFEAVNARSLIAVSDGNPNATTARMANYAFDRFGRYNRQTAMYLVNPDDLTKDGTRLQFRLGGHVANFEADDFEGTTAQVHTSLDWNFSQYVGTSLGGFVGYNSIEDANIYHAGVNFGVPVRVLLPSERFPFTLQITPHATVGGSGSEEIGAGGLIWSVGGTGVLRWDITKKLGLEFAAQYAHYEGETLEFGDFKIDPGVSQQIFKHGANVDWALGESGWYLYGGAAYTNFVQDAALDGYLSPVVGVGWRRATRAGTNFEVGFTGDYGEDYASTGIRAGINLAF